MSQTLNPSQRSLLEAALVEKQQRLEQTLQAQLGGEDRVTHAREQLLQDADDAREHDADREVDLARSDLNLEALRAVNEALQRLRGSPDYGFCSDCGKAISFERLQLNPEVLRCIDCQSTLEKAGGGASHPRL
jgi:RNA polymerase-binding transcription factor DksA